MRLPAFFLLVFALPASAQTLARFEPVVPDPTITGTLALRFVREHAQRIELQAWPTQEIGWLFVREEGTQHNLDALAPATEDKTLLRLERQGGGSALVGWDMPPRVEPTRPAELRTFLAERAGRKVLPREIGELAGNEPVPVLRLESMALVVGAPAGAAPAGPSAVASSKGGQRMELRALFDPSFVAAGSDLAFRLYLPEGGRQDVYVRCVHLASREARELELAQDGSVRARLDRSGAWMLEASRVRALDAAGPQGARLELASVTLVFVVPPAAGTTREDKR